MKWLKQKLAYQLTAALENPRTDGDNSKPSVRKNETPLGNLDYRWHVSKSERNRF